MSDPAQLPVTPGVPAPSADATKPEGVQVPPQTFVSMNGNGADAPPAPAMDSIPPSPVPSDTVSLSSASPDPVVPTADIAAIDFSTLTTTPADAAPPVTLEIPDGPPAAAIPESDSVPLPPLPPLPDDPMATPADTTSPSDAMITPLIATPKPDAVLPPVPPSDPVAAAQAGATSITDVTAAGSAGSVLEALLQQNDLRQDQVEPLKLESASSGKSVEQLIEEKELVSEEVLTKAKARVFNIPFINLDEIGVSPEAISQIPESVARRYQMIPFMVNKAERVLSVAMKNPLDLTAIDFAEKKTGYTLQPNFATPSEIDRLINERYAQNLTSEVNEALKESKLVTSTHNLDNLSALSKEVVREAPITKIVETILGFAVKSRASDVHIEPQEDRTRVRYRIDGILTEKLILPRSVHEAVLSRVKILADLKIDEKRLPQDGRFTFTADGQEVDLRVSTLPTVHGEKVVMRLLQKNSNVPSLNDLGLRAQALRDVEEAIKIPHGIILVTGPTGSGKTTTLYSVLHKINTPKVNISTLEDPVEYQIAGVNQVQINPQAGLTFASGLRAFLRQDPNIIMVGEIRDKETAELAVQASLTGHLVFSTLHTNSAAGAIPRLLDMEVEPFLLASSLTLCISQRVVRKINPEYIEEYTPEPAIVEDIKKVLGPLFTAWCTQNKKDPEKVTLFRAKKDRPETENEYKGRVGIYEVMKITEEVTRRMIERSSAADLEKIALNNGMLLMKQDGYLKALDGMTTIEEVLRVAEV